MARSHSWAYLKEGAEDGTSTCNFSSRRLAYEYWQTRNQLANLENCFGWFLEDCKVLVGNYATHAFFPGLGCFLSLSLFLSSFLSYFLSLLSLILLILRNQLHKLGHKFFRIMMNQL